MAQYVALEMFFHIVSLCLAGFFDQSRLHVQAHNIVTIGVKVPLLLNCFMRPGSWHVLTATPDGLDDRSLNMCYWNSLLVAGFYFWELMLDDLKPSVLAHHLTAILGFCCVLEWLEFGAVGNAIRQTLPISIIMATGGAPTICLPIVICDVVSNDRTKKLAMLLGAIAGTILYTVADAFVIHLVYSNLFAVRDVGLYFTILPLAMLLGLIPLQVASFSRMFAIASRGRKACNKSVSRETEGNNAGRQASPISLGRSCSDLTPSNRQVKSPNRQVMCRRPRLQIQSFMTSSFGCAIALG